MGPRTFRALLDHFGSAGSVIPKFQEQIARGATEDQAVIAVKLQQYEKLPTYAEQREMLLRRMYKEMTGKLP